MRVARRGLAKVGEEGSEPSAHRQVQAAYFEAFEAAYGRAPTWAGREGKAAKDLLTKLRDDADEACRRIRNAFSDPWWKSRNLTIGQIASAPDRFVAPSAPAGGSTKGVLQPVAVGDPAWAARIVEGGDDA